MSILGIGFVACVAISGIALAWALIGVHPPKAAHAAGVLTAQTKTNPGGVALDAATQHLWIAEPGCDASPVCGSTPPQGAIGEYDSNLNKIQDFTPPTNSTYNPVFITLDKSGNLWFTDPTHGAIGELVPGGSTWTEYSIAKTFAGATPYDLVFDQNGKLWFSDFANGTIGEFDTKLHTAVETTTPTAKTNPYGITLAPNGTIWFTENNVSKVGSFTPPATGTLPKTAIKEYSFSGVAGVTPHMITVDHGGNVWFSTGFGGQIAEVPMGQTTIKTFCISTSVLHPHISGIGVDGSGNVWFDDSTNERVGYLTPSQYSNDCITGTASGITYSYLPSASHPHDGLIVDSQSNVYLTEEFSMQVVKIPVGTTLPPPADNYPPGPTSKIWYFAEGRVGGGFAEYITLDNPDPANDCLVSIQYLLQTGNPVTKQLTVLHASRYTESVNSDLGVTVAQTGIAVATIVSTTPNSPCFGIVAERPMYFNFHGDQSNTDVVGATKTAQSFYFADVPDGGGYSSFITILNPPGSQAANVTATYYANGSQVGTQSITVNAGARGTIAPGALTNLPQHVAAVVTSTQPIVVERPTYFLGIAGGIAGTVTGASSVVGSQSLQNQWFFAEGYAGTSSSGGKTQENLVIANLDPANQAVSVTINLEYINGIQHSFTLTVPSRGQAIWNVNTNGVGATSNEVSATITSSGAMIVVERQMYFQYMHTLNGTMLRASGGTEVTGQAQAFSAYSFAEGYNNKGYNEWLTLQNPTGSAETIYLVMINGYGSLYTQTITVGANTRYTQDISALVLAHMVQSGQDHRAYEVSMTVETLNGGIFVAERPMYVNTFGVSAFPTQGGSDAFGYDGN